MIDAATRRLVHDRAGGRCEYCRIHNSVDVTAAFHVEHIRAKQHGAGMPTKTWLSHVTDATC